MQFYALRRPQLLHRDISPEIRDAVLRRNAVGLLPYLVATALAVVSPYLTLAIAAVVGVFYAVPSTTADVASSRT
jgi:hypothetical protein